MEPFKFPNMKPPDLQSLFLVTTKLNLVNYYSSFAAPKLICCFLLIKSQIAPTELCGDQKYNKINFKKAKSVEGTSP